MSSPSSTATTAAGSREATIFGHPPGIYICFATELWERFSFYGLKYLLLLYLTKYHLFSDSDGLHVLAAYMGLVYALPVIGGMISDRYLGMRKSVVFGGILLCLGHLTMAVEGHQAVEYAAGTLLAHDLKLADGTLLVAGTVLTNKVLIQDTAALKIFYFALALITTGVGFLKANISTIVGRLYEKGDTRRDAGFTIFYMGINTGSFTGTLLCGYLGETYGWNWGFGLAGIGMVVGLIVFVLGQKFLQGYAEPARPEILKEKLMFGINREWTIYLLSIASLFLVWLLVQAHTVVLGTQITLGLIFLGWLTWFCTTRCTPVERDRLLVMVVLIISTVVFWALFEQSAASMTLYADRVVNRTVYAATFFPDDITGLRVLAIGLCLLPLLCLTWGYRLRAKLNRAETGILLFLFVLLSAACLYYASNVFSFVPKVATAGTQGREFIWELTASQTGSLNAMFIILCAPLIAWLWTLLSRFKLEPSTPVKFALGIAQAGLGFGALVIGATLPDQSGKVLLVWLALAYLLHSTGELCLSPVGLSAVTKLSLPNIVGIMMGAWFLATALSETTAALMSKLAAVETKGGEITDVGAALTTYTDFFTYLLWVGVSVGLLMWLISPLLRKRMHGIH